MNKNNMNTTLTLLKLE